MALPKKSPTLDGDKGKNVQANSLCLHCSSSRLSQFLNEAGPHHVWTSKFPDKVMADMLHVGAQDMDMPVSNGQGDSRASP